MKRYWFEAEETRRTKFYVDAENEDEAYDLAEDEVNEVDWDCMQYECTCVRVENLKEYTVEVTLPLKTSYTVGGANPREAIESARRLAKQDRLDLVLPGYWHVDDFESEIRFEKE